MAKEFGKTSLCGVRHVGDVRVTEDERGREGRKDGRREKSPDLSAISTTVWEAKVPGTAFLYSSLYLRSPDCCWRRNGWEGKQSWTTAQWPRTHLNRIEGRVMVSCS